MGKLNGAENAEGAAVYVPWGTFKNSIIDGLAEGLPHVIDRSIFRDKMAGGVQSSMMSGLKFLALIDEDGAPTEALVKLTAESEQERKAALAEILKRRYAALISIDLEKATMKQLLDTLETAYRVSGETREKAARFFISAAQYAGIPLSRYITEGGVSIGRRKTAAAKRAASPATVENVDPARVQVPLPSQPPQFGEHRVVQLASGGTLTLSASVGFMKLAKSDRDFVFGLIDQLDAYESANVDEESDED